MRLFKQKQDQTPEQKKHQKINKTMDESKLSRIDQDEHKSIKLGQDKLSVRLSAQSQKSAVSRSEQVGPFKEGGLNSRNNYATPKSKIAEQMNMGKKI